MAATYEKRIESGDRKHVTYKLTQTKAALMHQLSNANDNIDITMRDVITNYREGNNLHHPRTAEGENAARPLGFSRITQWPDRIV
jgi:hypothetical protein